MVSKVTVEEGGGIVAGTSADGFCSPANNNNKKKIHHQHVSVM